MGAQNFIFDPKCPQNKSFFQLQSLHFSTKNFRLEEDFPTAQNLGGGCLRPRRHWVPSSTRLPPCPSWSPAPLIPGELAHAVAASIQRLQRVTSYSCVLISLRDMFSCMYYALNASGTGLRCLLCPSSSF